MVPPNLYLVPENESAVLIISSALVFVNEVLTVRSSVLVVTVVLPIRSLLAAATEIFRSLSEVLFFLTPQLAKKQITIKF